MKYLINLLTPNEQKILLVISAFLVLGSVLQVFGFQVSANENTPAADSLQIAIKEDKILLIDIRIATKEELMSLSGIGSKRADDIIAYRTTNPFSSVNQIMNVKGIGEKTYLKIYPNLVIFGDSLSFPTHSDGESKASQKTPPKSDITAKVNLNTADLEELCTLEGIGQVKAMAIIEYRKTNGKFITIEDFTKVKGIGQKTLEKNRHRLSVD